MKEDTKGVSQTFSGLRAASNISQPFLFFWHNQKYMFMSQVLIQTINKNMKCAECLIRPAAENTLVEFFKFSSSIPMQTEEDIYKSDRIILIVNLQPK